MNKAQIETTFDDEILWCADQIARYKDDKANAHMLRIYLRSIKEYAYKAHMVEACKEIMHELYRDTIERKGQVAA